MGAALVVAALLLAPGAALDPPEAMPSAAALVALVVLGLVCTAARLVVYGMLVAEAGAGRALVITYVNSVVAVALGMIFLGERPGPGALVGLGLILVGSWLATASAGGPRTTPSTRPGRPISSMPPEPPSSAGTPTAYPFASPHLGRYTEEVDITVSQVSDPDDPAFDRLLDIYRGIEAERDPDDPPIPRQELAASVFAPSRDVHKRAWLAWLGGSPVGAALSEQQLDGVNDGVIDLNAMVPADHRRGGVGRALVAAALPSLLADGGTSLVGWTPTASGAAFCRSLGLTHRSDDRCSRLRIAEIDPVEQRRWIDEGPVHAPGYRLVGWVGVVPDDWAETLARALDAMVDAPVDDLDWVTQLLTATRLRDREESWDRRGWDIVTTLALAPDGSGAGVSQILVSRLTPAVGAQGDTGVVAEHRGHRLGRWLKAANLRRALAHQPAIRILETFNAESNPHMLSINVAMGYRPHHAYASYQAPMAEVLARLAPGHLARGLVDGPPLQTTRESLSN
jgi:GNAT superfamily N-acetyltransferase